MTSGGPARPASPGVQRPISWSRPVAAVLFDYGLTLVHFERPTEALEEAQRSIGERIAAAGHPRPEVTLLQAAVHDRIEAEVAAHEASGALEEVDVAALEERAFADVGLHLDAALRDQCSRLAQEAWFHGVQLYADAAPALHTLRAAGLRIGLCSNAPYRVASMHDQLAHIGLDALVDAAVFSGEVGWRKPSPRLFEAVLAGLQTRADDAVFVGDRLREDVRGAAAVGMRTVLIDRRGQVTSVTSTGDGPDAVITSLLELPALLLGDATDVTMFGNEN